MLVIMMNSIIEKIRSKTYMTKPFNPMEVVARVKAQLRRYGQYNTYKHEEAIALIIGSLRLDISSCMLYMENVNIELTSREFMILKMLMDSPGRVFTKK